MMLKNMCRITIKDCLLSFDHESIERYGQLSDAIKKQIFFGDEFERVYEDNMYIFTI